MHVATFKSSIPADSQLSELAKLLALGLMRLRRHKGRIATANQAGGQLSRKSDQEGLEVSTETVLSVHNG